MKTVKVIGWTIFSFFLVQMVWAEQSPVPMLEKAANQIIGTLKANKASLKNNPQIVTQAVERHLVPIVDVEGMSRSVLGRDVWSKASAAERREFSRAFTQLVIRTYASPLAEYSNETVQFMPVRGEASGQFTRVNSQIVRSNGPNIPLSYSLVSKNGQWKVYDMSVEGVSLLQSFRSQFGQALKQSDLKTLVKQMNQKKVA